jgi:hypothetical protein
MQTCKFEMKQLGKLTSQYAIYVAITIKLYVIDNIAYTKLL